MNILIVSDSLQYGGVAIASQALRDCLASETTKVEHISIYGQFVGRFYKLRSLFSTGLKIHRSNSSIVVLMHFDAIFLGIFLKIFGKKKILVNVIHTDLCGYVSTLKSFKFLAMKIFIYFLRNRLVVFVSKESEIKAIDQFKLTKTTTIYNTFSHGKFADNTSQSKSTSSQIVFGSVSRLHNDKNIDLLIRVFNQFWLENKRSYLKIYGDGPESVRLEKYSRRFECTKAIVFEGHQKNLDTVYKSFDALVSFSRIEGFPLVILEALQRRIPVLHSDCSCGPREILSPFSNPQIKTNSIELCAGGVLAALPDLKHSYANNLQNSEKNLLDAMFYFYENFNSLKSGNFVSIVSFSAAEISKQWMLLFRELRLKLL